MFSIEDKAKTLAFLSSNKFLLSDYDIVSVDFVANDVVELNVSFDSKPSGRKASNALDTRSKEQGKAQGHEQEIGQDQAESPEGQILNRESRRTDLREDRLGLGD